MEYTVSVLLCLGMHFYRSYALEFQAAQIRVVFQLPSRFTRLQDKLAYVELFTPFKDSPNDDGTYTICRSKRKGRNQSRIIKLDDVILGCHLVADINGAFGAKGPWTSGTALEEASSFTFNIFSSLSMYAMILHNKIY